MQPYPPSGIIRVRAAQGVLATRTGLALLDALSCKASGLASKAEERFSGAQAL